DLAEEIVLVLAEDRDRLAVGLRDSCDVRLVRGLSAHHDLGKPRGAGPPEGVVLLCRVYGKLTGHRIQAACARLAGVERECRFLRMKMHGQEDKQACPGHGGPCGQYTLV